MARSTNSIEPIHHGSYRFGISRSYDAQLKIIRCLLIPGDGAAFAVVDDLKQLGIRKQRRSLSRAMGIVPPIYFTTHFPFTLNVVGFTLGTESLVAETTNSIFGHELVHTFVGRRFQPNEDYGLSIVRRIDGFDAFNARAISSFRSIMDADLPLNQVWIDKDRYQLILHDLSFGEVDPELIIVAGIAYSDGRFEVTDTIFSSEGMLSPSFAGTLKIETLDENGSPLISVLREPEFEAHVSWTFGVAPPGIPETLRLSLSPVVVALPYNSEVATVRVSLNGNEQVTLDPIAKSLVHSVNKIPLSSIKTPSAERKKSYIRNVELIELEFQKQNMKAGCSLLLNLENEIERNVGNFEVETTSRPELIKIIGHAKARCSKRGKSR